jgi:peptidoglycan/LPS O-acetylase OafA/YrhL
MRHRNRINAIFGLLLIGLAIFIPIIVPRNERKDLLIVTIFFGLVGALMIFTAFLPTNANSPSAKTDASSREIPFQSRVTKKFVVTPQKSPSRSAFSIGLGMIFLISGLFAPYVLPNVTPDERFLMMIGFAPVAAVGGLLLWIFLRGAESIRLPKRKAPLMSSDTKPRAPVTRAPQHEPYQILIPLVIIGLIALLVITVVIVVLATFIPFASLF